MAEYPGIDKRPSWVWFWLLIGGAGCALFAPAAAVTSDSLALVSSYLRGTIGVRLDTVDGPFLQFSAWASAVIWLPLGMASLAAAALAWVGIRSGDDRARRALRMAGHVWILAQVATLLFYQPTSCRRLPVSTGLFALAVLLPILNIPARRQKSLSGETSSRARGLRWLGPALVIIAALVVFAQRAVAIENIVFTSVSSGVKLSSLPGLQRDFVRFFLWDFCSYLAMAGVLISGLVRHKRAAPPPSSE